jgi:aspartate-semialdehyde dehydrogenase
VLLKVLEEYDFPIKKLFLFASEKSVGKVINYKDEEVIVKKLEENSFKDIDFAFFVSNSNVSKKWAFVALNSGAIVIDNSSYFRLNSDVSLIVPEVNFSDFNLNIPFVSNPNCSTIQSVLVLNALKKFGIKRVIYNTYQAVSGSGVKGIKALTDEKSSFYPYNIKETCIPKIDDALDNDYTKEEMKMINETKKILHMNDLNLSATCVRVPVLNSHAVSVMVQFDKEFSIKEVIDELSKHSELVIVNDLENNLYPVSTLANNNDKVYVGRIRRDLSNSNSILFYCVADNLRRGAASNAVFIAKKIIENYKRKGIA